MDLWGFDVKSIPLVQVILIILIFVRVQEHLNLGFLREPYFVGHVGPTHFGPAQIERNRARAFVGAHTCFYKFEMKMKIDQKYSL